MGSTKLKRILTTIAKAYICITVVVSLGLMAYYLISCQTIRHNHHRSYYFDKNSVSVNSLEEAQRWCYYNIKYKYDIDTWGVNEYWQSPEQTYILGTGDCEDYCLMFMYLCKHNLNIEPMMVAAKNKTTGTYHCLVKIGKDYYDITQMLPGDKRWKRGESISDTHEIVFELPYDMAMHMVYCCHDYEQY